MLQSVSSLSYSIVLCDDIERMKTFYRNLLPFPVTTETDTSLAFLRRRRAAGFAIA
ncbi:MAG: hypothetical protein CM1200mP2_17090 [Planctomycetaceae bacterium]|nr:MAG: hypothetical protein CM1200mP2_17090 [Planctomycetaceae bacterium]